jgi:glutamate dehydrogenase
MFASLDIVEVASETGLDVERVAGVHFSLGSQLELHWLRDRVVALPRHDRWSALARAALRDDLYSLHRDLTAEVLRSGKEVEDWIAANPATERYLATLADVRLGRNFDLTTLPVVVREVRQLVEEPAGGD